MINYCFVERCFPLFRSPISSVDNIGSLLYATANVSRILGEGGRSSSLACKVSTLRRPGECGESTQPPTSTSTLLQETINRQAQELDSIRSSRVEN